MRRSDLFALTAAVAITGLIFPDSAHALFGGSGLEGINNKLEEFNTWLISLGSVFAVTGFIWAVLAFMGRLGGFASAVTMLFAGMAVANAEDIVRFFIS